MGNSEAYCPISVALGAVVGDRLVVIVGAYLPAAGPRKAEPAHH